jgi:hypothetical protein
MSIGSLGLVGSLATSPLSQKGVEADKGVRETADQSRVAQAAQLAEAAAGIGETEEDSQAAERDADGRRLWERPGGKPPAAAEAPPTSGEPHPSKDPRGEAGGQLDLVV